MWHCIGGLRTHKYGYIVHWMKTTIEVDDRLLIEAKKWAAEKRTTLRNLVERGLRDQISAAGKTRAQKSIKIRWVTANGGLPAGVDLADRDEMSRMFGRKI